MLAVSATTCDVAPQIHVPGDLQDHLLTDDRQQLFLPGLAPGRSGSGDALARLTDGPRDFLRAVRGRHGVHYKARPAVQAGNRLLPWPPHQFCVLKLFQDPLSTRRSTARESRERRCPAAPPGVHWSSAQPDPPGGRCFQHQQKECEPLG